MLPIPDAQLLVRRCNRELERAGQRAGGGIEQLANAPHELIHERVCAWGGGFSQDQEAHQPSTLVNLFGKADLRRILHGPARHDPQLRTPDLVWLSHSLALLSLALLFHPTVPQASSIVPTPRRSSHATAPQINRHECQCLSRPVI